MTKSFVGVHQRGKAEKKGPRGREKKKTERGWGGLRQTKSNSRRGYSQKRREVHWVKVEGATSSERAHAGKTKVGPAVIRWEGRLPPKKGAKARKLKKLRKSDMGGGMKKSDFITKARSIAGFADRKKSRRFPCLAG